MTTPHGLGYAKIAIVVDADVDPFDLNQVMWAMNERAWPLQSARPGARIAEGRPMTATTASALPKLFPRCRATKIELPSTSPVPGVWSVFACNTYLYVWRSTEPDENTDPDKYPRAFRLNPADLPGLSVIRAIPPLRGK